MIASSELSDARIISKLPFYLFFYMAIAVHFYVRRKILVVRHITITSLNKIYNLYNFVKYTGTNI